jgi:GT2 family glycosyltransferase
MFIPQKSEAEQREFFDALYEKTIAAAAATSVVAHVLDVAGTRVRLAFAGNRLEQALMPALLHLRSKTQGDADVTFNIWDSESTGIAMIAPPCGHGDLTERGDIWGFGGDRYRVAFHWGEYSVNAFDRRSKTGVWWVESAEALPFWTKASPLRSLFHWWIEMCGKQLLHAAAIGNAQGAVLITGKGGVGKSTTALSALLQGLSYVADDYLIVGLDPAPTVYSLYSTAKLDPDQMTTFPELARHLTNEHSLDEQKAVLRLFPLLAQQLARSMPLRAVLTPRFGSGEKTHLAPASPVQLARAASFTTMCQLPYASRETSEKIEQMLASVPGFELVLGTDRPGVVRCIEELLAAPDRDLAAACTTTSTYTGGGYPLISVIVPVHNGAGFLREAVDSILGQHYPRIEIIVVDDGSTDNLGEVVASLPVDVRFLRQSQSGAAAARNRGIRDASGDLIAFLDVDDLWPENSLPGLIDTLHENPQAAAVHGHAQLLEQRATGGFEYVGNPNETFPYYVGAGLYRRQAFERVGLFDPELKFAEDTDWFSRALEANLALMRVPAVTLLVRRHGQNMTNDDAQARLHIMRAYKKQLDRKRRVAQAGLRLAARRAEATTQPVTG